MSSRLLLFVISLIMGSFYETFLLQYIIRDIIDKEIKIEVIWWEEYDK